MVSILNTELMMRTQVIQEELETRKPVEKAKETVMRRQNMTTDEAHRWIRKQSMDTRKSMRHVADALLIFEEL